VDQVANAVRVTLGPKGRNVVLQSRNGEPPTVVNDGVTIASEVKLPTVQEDVGVKLLLQAASKTDSRAGDGTTTSTVLTQAIMGEGLKYVTSGHNSIALSKGLIKAAAFFVKKIREAATPVTTYEQYQQIASISVQDWDMGGNVADALMRVGIDGSTTVEEGELMSDVVEFTEGMEVETGFVSDLLCNDLGTLSSRLVEPRVLVTDEKLTNVQELLPILEAVVSSKESLLIIATDVVQEALSALTLNQNRGVLDVCAVKAPAYGEVRRVLMQDICTFTGATLITSELGMTTAKATIADLGKLQRAVVEKQKTLLVSSGDATVNAAVDRRVEELKALKNELLDKANKEFEIQRLDQRIYKLRAAVARIKVGAPTEAEAKDRVLRYEDAINALTGAICEGMVPGGGSCLAYMTRYADECKATLPNDEERLAVDVLVKAMGAPVSQIATNAGILGEMVRMQVAEKEWGFGFNAKTMEYGNLFEEGVCDPCSVTTWALENAASISGSMLTTEALVTDAVRGIDPDDIDYEPELTEGIGKGAAAQAW